jgi:selenocysteine-specific elongation factor
VVNPFPGRRHRRFRAEVIERLETLLRGSPEEILLQDLERRQPCEARELLGRTSLARHQATDSLHTLVGDGQILLLAAAGGPTSDRGAAAVSESSSLISRSGWGALRERLEMLLQEYHERFPLRSGMPREEIKSRLAQHILLLTPRLFNEIVGRASQESWLIETAGESESASAGLSRAGLIRLASHQASFTTKQQQAVDYLLYTFRQDPYSTPSVTQAEEQLGGEVLSALVEQGRLVKLNEDVILLAETYEQMRDQIVAYLQEHERITVAQVRDLFGTSRKYALALAGYLDEHRITRRVGDERVLRSSQAVVTLPGRDEV